MKMIGESDLCEIYSVGSEEGACLFLSLKKKVIRLSVL